jgi:MFS family permease
MSENLETQKLDKFIEADAGDGTTVHDQQLHGVPLIMTFASCFITLFLIGLDQTIVLTILVKVGTKFDAYNQIGWVSGAYMLTLAVFAASWGKASIIFGRKPTVLLAIFLFEAGSLVCALANDMSTLIGGRVLAGIGGAGIQNITMIIGSELVPISKKSLAFAFLGISFAVSSIAGPLIGGVFTDKVSWRWCFYINLPLGGAAALALVVFFKPPRTKGSLKEKFLTLDYIGISLMTVGLVLFLLALTFGGEEFPWKSGAVISMFILGGIISGLFCVWNFKYSKSPLIPLPLIQTMGVLIPALAMFLVFFAFLGLSVYTTTFFQIILGRSAFRTGVDLLPIVIALIISSIATGVLIRKTRYIKPFGIFAGAVGVIGMGLTTLWKVDSSSSAQIGFLILPGVSIGCLLQVTMIAMQVSAPKIPGGAILSMSFLNFSRALGGTFGVELSQVIFNSSARNKVLQAAAENPEIFEGISYEVLSSIAKNPLSLSTFNSEARELVLEALMGGIRNVFYTSTGVSGLFFVFTIFFPNKRLPSDEEVQTKEEYEKKLNEAKNETVFSDGAFEGENESK